MKSNTSQRNSLSTGWHKVRNTCIGIAVGYQQTTKLNHSNLDSLGWDAGVYGAAARIAVIEVSNQDICQVNVIPVSAHPPLGVRDYLATALFATSWLFEIGTCWLPCHFILRCWPSRHSNPISSAFHTSLSGVTSCLIRS